jgi:hypothetical protein
MLVRARGNCLTKKIKEVEEKLMCLFLEYPVVPYICTLGKFSGLLQLN